MMSKEDMRFSHVTWAGNLYQKFEAMCHEVDDIVSQEQIKNLENHVQSVGENVMKFYSNVKDLFPSSVGVPGKQGAQFVTSIKSNFDCEGCDGDHPSAAEIKQLPRQMDVSGSLSGYPICTELGQNDLKGSDGDCPVSDEHHSEDKLETPFSKEPRSSSSGLQLRQSDSFLINQGFDSHSKEEKQSSEISESTRPGGSDSFIKDKQLPFDASELTCPESSLTSQNSDSFTKNEEELLAMLSEFIFPDEDPSDSSISSISDNHDSFHEVSIYSSPSNHRHSSSSEHLKEQTVQDNVNGYGLGSDFLHKDEVIDDRTHKGRPGSELQLKEEVLCNSINKFSLGSGICLKEEMVLDSVDKCCLGSEFQVEEEIVHDDLSERCFDVSLENVHYSLLASSVASSESETSNVRLASSIKSPLLEFSDHCKPEFLHREVHTVNNVVVENGTASHFSSASESSEASPYVLSPNEKIRDIDSGMLPSSSPLTLTEVPDASHSDDEGLKQKHMEFSVKVELDGSCVLVETDDNYPASCTVQRALRKKIMDSLCSRKKLEKEYKQLAIWYCNIDEEFGQVSEQKLVPSNPNMQLQARDVPDSEWELL